MNNTDSPEFKKELKIKSGEKILATIKNFSATEKVIFGLFVTIALISTIVMVLSVNKLFIVEIPTSGGSLNEGIVGLPRLINPVIATSDADRDLVTLVYSGLTKYDGGKLVPDLAKKYTVSTDGLVYTFTLKDNLRFSDGAPLTSTDVEFTINRVEDTSLQSPHRADWAHVTVKVLSPTQFQFILKQPYTPFLSNTTLGILPKHIWGNIDSEHFIFSKYNLEPIGSGPYKVDTVRKDSAGTPISFILTPFDRYNDKPAYLDNVSIYFYQNEKDALTAYKDGNIDSVSGISGTEAAKIASSTVKVANPSASVLSFPLSRIFGLFFNQNQSPVLADHEVRAALNLAVDRKEIIKKVLAGYGIAIDSPIPDDIKGESIGNSTSSLAKYDPAQAVAILKKAGYSENADGIMQKKDSKGIIHTLEFSISTANTPDLKQTAEILKTQWEKIGANVTVKVFEYGDLYQNVIATRKYDSLLFGEFIAKDLDLYAFWHSSQRNSPGLNVAMYVNSKADKVLEDMRTSLDENARDNTYSQFEKIIKTDVPAIFLYSPDFIYVVPTRIKGINIGQIQTPSDRLYNINKWYIKTDKVWKIFTNN